MRNKIEKTQAKEKKLHAQDSIYVVWQFSYIYVVAGISLLSGKKIQSPVENHTILFQVLSGHQPDQTQLGSTKPSKSPTWRLVQSPTSTVIFQKQSLIPATHPPILKLENQLKLHITSASQ